MIYILYISFDIYFVVLWEKLTLVYRKLETLVGLDQKLPSPSMCVIFYCVASTFLTQYIKHICNDELIKICIIFIIKICFKCFVGEEE